MTATQWPTSEYAAKCAWCAQGIPSNEPRVREDAMQPGMRGRRSWHPECYPLDPSGLNAQGAPRAASAAGGPSGARGQRPGPTSTPTTGSPTPSVPPAPSPASPPAGATAPPPSATPTEAPEWRVSTPREAGWCWVTVEARAKAVGGDATGEGIVRIAEIVPALSRDEVIESFRGWAAKNAVRVAQAVEEKRLGDQAEKEAVARRRPRKTSPEAPNVDADASGGEG